ncbi:PadR family transcriptional regulator [Youngiibacter fragilis]|uniref:PadR family transcriptional regulator n=1 Tax=Youngiibacter fragilis 232.1 TaxID=994573 RepID=V7I2U0_9CLOT|nr:PadR family transcriptional regulator [Youngiibacter fragilis]ETA79581.1 PadR family transcriptional regulator [Youngiibacter fragilis 232.1]
MEMRDETYDGLVSEFRRGFLVLGVLSQLIKPQYGYSLNTMLDDIGLKIDSGTLYPLLRRLEKQGLLESMWDTDSGKPRKYYRLTEYGMRILRDLQEEWRSMADLMERLIEGGK